MKGVLMSYNFIPCDRDQILLLPPDLREWLPSGHLAWFIIDAVDQMDLSPFYEQYREDGKGNTAFDPSMMIGLYLYSYCMGERSSRRIERLCMVDIAYRVITANRIPDHTTIARFRKDNIDRIEHLFVEVLRLCREAKMLKLGTVALDGTKMKGNASLEVNRTSDALETEVRRILREADETDAKEDSLYGSDRRGDELPEELADSRSRISRLRECKRRLDREAREARDTQQRKIDNRAAEEESGNKKRGRKPLPADAVVDKEAKANVTDPDSRIMKTRSGFVQGYNAQAVATKDQIILAAEVTQEENDMNQLLPMIDEAQEMLDKIEEEKSIKTISADAGYFSETNVTTAPDDGPDLFIATKKDWKQRKEQATEESPKGRIPGELTVKERMERKLLTEAGKAIYAKRKVIIEPIFGQIKDAQGIRTFLMRGIAAVKGEWKLICASHNLRKLFAKGKCAYA
jgi:transposase